MAYPTAYYPAYNFTQYQASHPSTPLPAASLDAELFSISTSVTEIVQSLEMIQRSDGALANESVGFAQLQPGLTIGLSTPATNWTTATAYVVNNAVYENDNLYICAVSHTSTVFATDLANGDWVLMVNFNQYVTAAASSATAAASSATAAASSASAASTSATNAAASAAAAAASASGMNWRPPVAVATTGSNITLSGTQTIDGYAVQVGDRVLVKDQSTTANNGVYVAASGAWSRATDANTWSQLPGLVVVPENGTLNQDYAFICTVAPGGTLGVTAITFTNLLVIPAPNSVTSGTIAAGAVGTSALAANAVTLAKLATQGADTVLVNATGSSAVPTALSMPASTILARLASGDIVAATVAQINALLGGTPAWMSIGGCIISGITGTHTTAALSVSAGNCADSTGASYIVSAGYSWAASNGNAINGTDAGSSTLANSTTYHVFLCSGASGTGTFVSASLTPTFPSGYTTYKRRIGSFNTDSSGNPLAYTSVEVSGGGTVNYLGSQVLDVNDGTLGTSRKLYTLSVPSGVKMQPLCRFQTAANFAITLFSPDESDVAATLLISGGAPGNDVYSTSSTNSTTSTPFLTTNTSAQIAARAASTSGSLFGVTRGWIDFRRA